MDESRAADDAVAGEWAWVRDKRALFAILPMRKMVRVAGSGFDEAKSLLISIGLGASQCQTFVTVI